MPPSSEDPQELFELVARYGEDFDYEYTCDERTAFDDFAHHAAGDPRAATLIALDRLLATATTELELRRRRRQMSFAYVVQAGGSPTYRDFLLWLRGWLVESFKERPPGPVPQAGR